MTSMLIPTAIATALALDSAARRRGAAVVRHERNGRNARLTSSGRRRSWRRVKRWIISPSAARLASRRRSASVLDR